jgi:hypothetical protein
MLSDRCAAILDRLWADEKLRRENAESGESQLKHRDWLFPYNAYGLPSPHRGRINLREEGLWPHPSDEPSRVAELEAFLAKDFNTFREVWVEHAVCRGRLDILAVPKAEDLEVAIAFEVKGEGFDVERSLKQSADYVGARVLDGPHRGKRIAACFLYPVPNADGGVFNLIAQWRVGRGYVSSGGELTLAIGYENIWRSQRSWSETRANRMLLCKRTVGGSRREPELGDDLRLEDLIELPTLTRRFG